MKAIADRFLAMLHGPVNYHSLSTSVQEIHGAHVLIASLRSVVVLRGVMTHLESEITPVRSAIP